MLDPHISTRGEMAHSVLTLLGMVAQIERRFIKNDSGRVSSAQKLMVDTGAARSGSTETRLSAFAKMALGQPRCPANGILMHAGVSGSCLN